VRILKTGDGGFIVACGCGPESVDDAEESPHPITDHLVNIYAEDPSPAQWLTLEGAADGWYDTTAAWDSPEGFEGVNGQRRARFRGTDPRDCRHERPQRARWGDRARSRRPRGRVRIAAPALERSASGRRGIPFGNRTPSASRRPLKPELLQTTPGVRASRSRPSRPISAGGRSADAVAARGRADGSRHVRRDRRGDDRTRRRWVRRAGGVGDRSGRFVRLPREPHRGDGYRSVWRRDRRAARSCSE